MITEAAIVVTAIAFLVYVRVVTRCKHAWEVVVERELPSPAEVAKSVGTPLNIAAYRTVHHDFEACAKRVVVVLKCPKCGRLWDRTFSSWSKA